MKKGEWGAVVKGQEGFCFVFSMGDARACCRMTSGKGEITMQTRKEVPAGSKSLKVRVGGVCLTGGV